MSHNPTYDPEPGYDQSSYNPYAEQGRNSPQQQDFSNMASYRQATVGGAPPGTVGAPDNGKSYRYATEAIPEDDEEGGDGRVHFTNGGQPTKTYSASSEPKSSQSCWSKYGLLIMIGVAILFAVLFFIFLGLYVSSGTSVNTSNTPESQKGVTKPSSTIPPSTTTPEPETGIPIGTVDIDGEKVTKFTLDNGNVKVELLSLGARLNKLLVNNVDYVLGFNTPDDANVTEIAKYVYGSANGRICGDITSLNFDGKDVTLTPANGETKFSEGGLRGFYQMNFVGEQTGQTVTFTKTVTSAMDGFPGSAKIKVMYTLHETENKLTVSMTATPADNGDSLIDMCNSVRFNLNGDGSDVTPHQLMINAKKYHDTSARAWEDVSGVTDFRSSVTLKEKIEAITGAVNPNLKVFQYSYELLGASGMKLAGIIKLGNRQVTVHTNQDVARISVILEAFSIPGKATQPYGPKSSVSFITHADPYATGTDHLLLKADAMYKSEVSYTLS